MGAAGDTPAPVRDLPDSKSFFNYAHKLALDSVAIHRDFAAHHEKRGGVAVGQREFRRFPRAQTHVPQIDGCECF